jgi:nucleoside-diphosphate-sugar epimerase
LTPAVSVVPGPTRTSWRLDHAGPRDPRASRAGHGLDAQQHEVTIRETVETVARLVGFTGELRWDPTKPDGQPRRRVDATRANELLEWHASTPFEDGLRATIDWYLANRTEAERPAA